MIELTLKSENRKTKILAVLAFWFLFFIIEILKKGLLRDTLDMLFYSYYLPGILIWILLTAPTYSVFRKFQNKTTFVRLIIFVVLGILVGTIKTYASWTISHFIQFSDYPFSSIFSKMRLFYFIEAWIISWVMLILFFIKELYDKYKNEKIKSVNLENQLTKAELHSLKMRLQPHFLFNAHNNIAMLVRSNKNKEAVEMISRLSDLLRLSLDQDHKPLITAKEEVEFTKLYLDVESLRFEDTLRVEYDISIDTEKKLVPNMVLQPIVENAIKHGISQHLGSSFLQIKANINDDYLIIRVRNTGPHLKKDFKLSESNSYGLKITSERLTNHYAGKGTINLFNSEDGVICELIIPAHE